MDINRDDEILIKGFPEEVTNIYYRFPKGSLEDDWKKEALEHRKTLEKIQKIVDNEKITGIEARLMIKDILEGK